MKVESGRIYFIFGKFKLIHMPFDFLDALEGIVDLLTVFGNDNSSSKNIGYDEKPKENKKVKYIVEKASIAFLAIASVLFYIVFKNPLPTGNYIQTLVVSSLIGLGIAFVFFFILHVLELYYFKSFFQLLLFSLSAILFFISAVMGIYFKSGLFI